MFDQTHMMDVQTGKWQEQSFPTLLNIGRFYHSSMSLRDQTFVACGYSKNGCLLQSVEMLWLGEEAWELINIPALTPRINPIFAQLDAANIAILDGFSGYEINGVILNAKTLAVVKNINPTSEITLNCYS